MTSAAGIKNTTQRVASRSHRQTTLDKTTLCEDMLLVGGRSVPRWTPASVLPGKACASAAALHCFARNAFPHNNSTSQPFRVGRAGQVGGREGWGGGKMQPHTPSGMSGVFIADKGYKVKETIKWKL